MLQSSYEYLFDVFDRKQFIGDYIFFELHVCGFSACSCVDLVSAQNFSWLSVLQF